MAENISDLEHNALKFWPASLASQERNQSIIPYLIETQDKFISLLNFADTDPFSWKVALSSSRNLSGNLFLKHLMVLSDVGGEKLMRFKTELPLHFPDKKLEFVWNEQTYSYTFKTLSGNKQWSNAYLHVDGLGLASKIAITDLMEDACMLLLFGGLSIKDNIPTDILEKCIIGNYIGHIEELELFVRQRYIWVSRITGGATANTLGNIGQTYIKNFLVTELPEWDFTTKKILNISQNDNTDLSYDIVAKSPTGKVCAIEVSFQVTTNSTIERKAGQAKQRQAQLHEAGYYIAYVIDGAGNFARKSALRTIFNFSDCTVSFKQSELNKLVLFLKSL